MPFNPNPYMAAAQNGYNDYTRANELQDYGYIRTSLNMGGVDNVLTRALNLGRSPLTMTGEDYRRNIEVMNRRQKNLFKSELGYGLAQAVVPFGGGYFQQLRETAKTKFESQMLLDQVLGGSQRADLVSKKWGYGAAEGVDETFGTTVSEAFRKRAYGGNVFTRQFRPGRRGVDLGLFTIGGELMPTMEEQMRSAQQLQGMGQLDSLKRITKAGGKELGEMLTQKTAKFMEAKREIGQIFGTTNEQEQQALLIAITAGGDVTSGGKLAKQLSDFSKRVGVTVNAMLDFVKQGQALGKTLRSADWGTQMAYGTVALAANVLAKPMAIGDNQFLQMYGGDQGYRRSMMNVMSSISQTKFATDYSGMMGTYYLGKERRGGHTGGWEFGNRAREFNRNLKTGRFDIWTSTDKLKELEQGIGKREGSLLYRDIPLASELDRYEKSQALARRGPAAAVQEHVATMYQAFNKAERKGRDITKTGGMIEAMNEMYKMMGIDQSQVSEADKYTLRDTMKEVLMQKMRGVMPEEAAKKLTTVQAKNVSEALGREDLSSDKVLAKVYDSGSGALRIIDADEKRKEEKIGMSKDELADMFYKELIDKLHYREDKVTPNEVRQGLQKIETGYSTIEGKKIEGKSQGQILTADVERVLIDMEKGELARSHRGYKDVEEGMKYSDEEVKRMEADSQEIDDREWEEAKKIYEKKQRKEIENIEIRRENEEIRQRIKEEEEERRVEQEGSSSRVPEEEKREKASSVPLTTKQISSMMWSQEEEKTNIDGGRGPYGDRERNRNVPGLLMTPVLKEPRPTAGDKQSIRVCLSSELEKSMREQTQAMKSAVDVLRATKERDITARP